MSLSHRHSLRVALNVATTAQISHGNTKIHTNNDLDFQETRGSHRRFLPPGLTHRDEDFQDDSCTRFSEDVEAIPHIGAVHDGVLQFNDSARLTPIEQVEPQPLKLMTPPLCYSNVVYSSPMLQHSSSLDYYSEPHNPAHIQQDGIPCPLKGLLPSIPYPVDTNGFTPLCTNPPLQPALMPYIPVSTPTQYSAPPIPFPLSPPPPTMPYPACSSLLLDVFSCVHDTVQIPQILPHSLDLEPDRTSSCGSPIFGVPNAPSMQVSPQNHVSTTNQNYSDASLGSIQGQSSIKQGSLSFTFTHSLGPDHPISTNPAFSNEPVAPHHEPLSSSYEKSLVLSFKESSGCKTLHQYLDEFPDRAETLMDTFIREYSTSLQMESVLVHPSGNYCFQIMIEKATTTQRLRILLLIQDAFFSICQNLHGTRSVQKFIECISSDEEKAIISQQLSIDNRVIKLIADINGNHCVQRCIETFTPTDCTFIYDQVIRELVLVSTHQHGCCIIQRCLDLCNEEQRIKIVSTVCDHVMELIVDRFGNYVFQYSLEKASVGLCGSVTTDDLIRPILGKEAFLITQKFSSHAVEKCIKHGSRRIRTQIINNILNSDEFLSLTMDRFGNYVVQKIFGSATDEQKGIMARRILASPSVLNCNYSRHVIQLCERYMDSSFRK